MRLTVGNGIDKYISQLETLSRTADDTIGKAVYAGADIIADQIKHNIEELPVQDQYGKAQQITGIRTMQKKGLMESFGIARMRNEMGYIHVKAGFDGYNGLKTARYPQGQPNAMIARTFESGNSFTKKTPFVAPAIRAKKDAAERKMADVVDTEIRNHISGG